MMEMNECRDCPAYDRAKLAKNQQLLGEAGVAGPLVAVLKTHSQSAAVMEQACRVLISVAVDGE